MSEVLIRYQPGEAIRWLQQGARSMRKEAERQSQRLVRREGDRTIRKDISEAASALFGVGKSAWADLKHVQASAIEYVLGETDFEVIKPTGAKRYAYDSVTGIKIDGDRAIFTFDKGKLVIAPYAHIVAGRVKAPIGWRRNGLEVPYELLVEELSARCQIDPEIE